MIKLNSAIHDVRFPEQINERSEIEIEPIRAIAGPYRHVRVQEKRKSQVSYSVAGHDLRWKRMRTEGERSQTVRVLQSDLLSDTKEEEVVLETEMLPDTDLEEISETHSTGWKLSS